MFFLFYKFITKKSRLIPCIMEISCLVLRITQLTLQFTWITRRKLSHLLRETTNRNKKNNPEGVVSLEFLGKLNRLVSFSICAPLNISLILLNHYSKNTPEVDLKVYFNFMLAKICCLSHLRCRIKRCANRFVRIIESKRFYKRFGRNFFFAIWRVGCTSCYCVLEAKMGRPK